MPRSFNAYRDVLLRALRHNCSVSALGTCTRAYDLCRGPVIAFGKIDVDQ